MVRFTLFAGAVLMAGVVACCMSPVANAQEKTPPANVAPVHPSYSSVLVLPFAPTSGASDWIGKGIQEDLATELVRQSRLDVQTPGDLPAAADAAQAAKIGNEKGASLVAFGSYQILESEVRINGQLIDTATGRPIAALKATGQRRDLFHMEDVLASQAVAALPAASVKVGAGAYASSNEPSPAPAPATTNNYYNNDAAPYNSQGYYVTPGPAYVPAYNYDAYTTAPAPVYDDGYSSAYTRPYSYYGSPWADYDYPFWGGGFIVINSGHHRHDHDHDGDHFRGTGSHERGFFNGDRTRQLNVVNGGVNGTLRQFNGGGFVRTGPGFQGSLGPRMGGFHAGDVGSAGGGLHAVGGIHALNGSPSGGGGTHGGGAGAHGGGGHR